MTPQMGKNQPRRTAERTPRQPPGPVSYWLIAEKRNSRLEALTIRASDEQETLPVFSSEEEADMILRFGGVTGGWRARESGAGDLVSVLSGPCAGVKKVALDPSPEMVVEGTVGLVSLPRESFMNLIMARRSGPPGPGDAGAPEARMAILGPERGARDGETEGTDLIAVPRRRGEVRE
ncbi:MAG TPA: hypothetical protein VHH10_01055 [Rubrobacteraceae bacterium]|nr:hypothetical protein [Rubrobacteraceae bacterium]